MLDFALIDRSPREYIRIPHETEQYGHVLRVSVACASLNSRTLAMASFGENPSSARLDPPSDAPVNFRNSRLIMSVIESPSTSRRTSRSDDEYTPRRPPPAHRGPRRFAKSKKLKMKVTGFGVDRS